MAAPAAPVSPAAPPVNGRRPVPAPCALVVIASVPPPPPPPPLAPATPPGAPPEPAPGDEAVRGWTPPADVPVVGVLPADWPATSPAGRPLPGELVVPGEVPPPGGGEETPDRLGAAWAKWALES